MHNLQKSEYFLTKKDKIMKEMAVCGKLHREYAECLKHAVNLFAT